MIEFDQLTGELGLKAIAWDHAGGKFTSPSWREFTWDKDCLVSASCGIVHKRETEEGIWSSEPCKDEDIPGFHCTCGLYSTFRWNIIALGYTERSYISPVLLVESCGKTVLHKNGIRSYQQGVRAVIDTSDVIFTTRSMFTANPILDSEYIAKRHAASAQASDYFKVPVLKRDVATAVMDLWNLHLNSEEGGFNYRPESEAIRKMAEDEIRRMSEMYLPRKEKTTWEDLLQRST